MHYFLLILLVLMVSILLLVLITELYQKFSRTAKLINKIPGPKQHPIIGSALDLIANPVEMFNNLREWSKQYYPIYKIWSSNAYFGVFLCSPEDMQIVLSNIKHNEKSDIYIIMHEWLGEGLLTSKGGKWQMRRKIITPTFHYNILRRFIAVFNKHSAALVEDFQNDSAKEVDILPHVHKAALQTIAEAAMGSTLADEESNKKYRNSIHRMGEILIYRILRPWLYIWLTNFFTKQFYEERLHLRYLRNFTKKVIDDREATFNESDITSSIQSEIDDDDVFLGKKKKRLAMLDLLLSAKNRNEIDYDGIREEVDTFTFEGHDTISMALSFAFMLIANHSDVQQILYEEIEAILGDGSHTREPTYDDLHRMTYMELVIKESLRLYPSVPLISRVCGEDFVASSGHVIPEGSLLVLNIYDTHRLESVYPEPEKFIPERFTLENSKNRHPYAYVPFSAGSRNCIGQRYAMLNMKCKIVAVIKQFVLLPVDTPETITLMTDLVLRTQKGIKIKLKPRHLHSKK